MRILILSPHSSVSGPIPRIASLLAESLRSLGCDVEMEPWGRHHEHESLPEKIFGRAHDIARIHRRLREEPFDVLLIKTSLEWMSLARDVPLLGVTRGAVQTIVLHFHGGRSNRLLGSGHRTFKAATATAFWLSDGVLVLSSEEQREAKRFWPRGKIYVVSNPFLPSAPRLNRGAACRDSASATLLFVGRLIEEKGIFDVLSALKLLRERIPCRLVVAGKGPQEDAFRERVSQLGLDDAVEIAGHLTSIELADIYAQAQVLVFPTWFPEGFPTVITEAMAAGLPIVTTRTRGIADHLVDGVNALFTPPRDPARLAESVQQLLEDPSLMARMTEANLGKIGDFEPQNVARQYLGVLEAIVRSGRSNHRKIDRSRIRFTGPR